MKVEKGIREKQSKMRIYSKIGKYPEENYLLFYIRKGPKKEVRRAHDRWKKIGSHPQYRDQCWEDSPGTSHIRIHLTKNEKALKGHQDEAAWDIGSALECSITLHFCGSSAFPSQRNPQDMLEFFSLLFPLFVFFVGFVLLCCVWFFVSALWGEGLS